MRINVNDKFYSTYHRSEYVDALQGQMEEGVFEISIAQLVYQPLICLQRKISPGLDLEAAEAPFPPLLMWTKSPAVSSQFLDLNVPPVSSDLVGHKPINCGPHA